MLISLQRNVYIWCHFIETTDISKAQTNNESQRITIQTIATVGYGDNTPVSKKEVYLIL